MGSSSATAPVGTVALAFTDVQGSTVLWERVPDAMRLGLALHDALLRGCLARAGGYEVKTEGDAFMVAFGTARAAVDWCLEVQSGLVALDWPAALLAQPEAAEVAGPAGARPLWRGLRVRMGVHSGEPEPRRDPTTGRMDYFGPPVNRAARVAGAAHGGQILASAAAMAQLDPLPGACRARGLGEVRLKGLSKGEILTELLPAGLGGRSFPPPRGEGVRRSNLAPEATTFIGRERELAALAARMEAGARVLTLLGPGGTGKTRLARALARRLFEDSAGAWREVWFVDLARARTAAEAARALAEVLGASGGRDEPELLARLGEALAARDGALLVLDNCEQVAEPLGRLLAGLLAGAPRIRILATSREPLCLMEEVRVPVEPLDAAGAAALFLARRGQVTGGELPALERAAIPELVSRLDHLPLAIELAAARSATFSPGDLLDQLGRRFELLRTRAPDRPARHATMEAALDWSWDLLDEPGRDALVRLSVLPAGFPLSAAVAVLGYGARPGGGHPTDRLEGLVDRSLVGASGGRFRLLETVREYAARRLQAEPGAAARAGLLAWSLDRAREAGDGTFAPNVRRPEVRGLAPEEANLTAARDQVLESDPEAAARLTLVLGDLCHAGGALVSLAGHARVAAALAPRVAPGRRAALAQLGALAAWLAGDMALCLARAREAEGLGRAAGDPAAAVEGVCTRGAALLLQGDEAGAEEALAGAAAEARERGISAVEVRSLGNMAHLRFRQCRFPEALELARATLERIAATGQAWALGVAHTNLGAVLLALGRWREALAGYRQAMAIHLREGDWRQELQTRCATSYALLMLGEADLKEDEVEDCLQRARELAYPWSEAHALHTLGMIRLLRGPLAAALEPFEASLAAALRTGDRNMEGLVRSCLVPALAAGGALDRARGEAVTARRMLGPAYARSMELFEAAAEVLGAADPESRLAAHTQAAAVLAAEAPGSPQSPANHELARRVLGRTLNGEAG